ncbi:midkine b [Engraulis encrasicolus]|uniref:midkine b n=1 Tax=Engraulis encrasicolus TaxID=184585 RepID=UPI002FD2A4E5
MRHFLLVTLLMAIVMAAEASKKKERGNKEAKAGAECAEWKYGRCVPTSGDCGAGMREATCNEQTKKHKCKVPCNWKKEFGADCKYKFGRWQECDTSTGTKSRSGTLKKALFNADCQATIKVSKPCSPKTKTKPAKKGRGGKEN